MQKGKKIGLPMGLRLLDIICKLSGIIAFIAFVLVFAGGRTGTGVIRSDSKAFWPLITLSFIAFFICIVAYIVLHVRYKAFIKKLSMETKADIEKMRKQ